MANHFDQAGRALAKTDAAAFVLWALRAGPDQAEFVDWIDARRVRFPNEPDRTCDTVARVHDPADGGRPWAVVIEFQSEPDSLMPGRLGGYLWGLWLEERPSGLAGDRYHLGGVVINLTGVGTTARDMRSRSLGLGTRLQVKDRNLARESASATLAGIRAGRVPRVVLPLIPLMQGGGEAGIIRRWLALASPEPDRRRRATYGTLALVFAELADRREAWAAALEGWDVRESQVVLGWQREARAEGRAEGRADALLRVLELRFGPPPADLASAVRSVGPDRHDGLFEAAVRAASLEEFRRQAGL